MESRSQQSLFVPSPWLRKGRNEVTCWMWKAVERMAAGLKNRWFELPRRLSLVYKACRADWPWHAYCDRALLAGVKLRIASTSSHLPAR